MNQLAAQPDIGNELAFRGPLSADLPFLIDSWIRSQWEADARRKMTADVFFPRQRARIMKCLGDSSVLIAMVHAAPDEALGYVVHGSMLGLCVVHWCYVKQGFRRLGIARCLLQLASASGPAGMVHTAKGDARGKKLLSRFHSKFDPYL